MKCLWVGLILCGVAFEVLGAIVLCNDQYVVGAEMCLVGFGMHVVCWIRFQGMAEALSLVGCHLSVCTCDCWR